MNGFERFDITHLSASSINLWINAPDVWVAKYLFKRGTPMGPAPIRGQAVEKAVVAALLGDNENDAIRLVEEWFDRRWLIGTEESTKERALIKPMTQIALEELREFGKPEFTDGTDQEKISINANFGDWSIPIWGFLDLVYPQHGVVVDLKTTSRVPSVMSAEHQLQRAIYHRAKGNHAVRFLYVSSKKAAWLEDGDPAEVLTRAKTHIARLEAFLRHCPDHETARQIVPVNGSSFFWRGAEPLLSEIYGL
ncbi:PD-(D/E)XK nuclease family protein [Paracoccus sp. (in: a-proteobacteria)]|uniref:PD-(D/E)XK nuclease family protein n=1 Tax=Paracoccus sp. TaxID=267 RepID=UPI002AFDEDCB|nr:PD-(D/E)XK nuclease family protein [Paracoccus sp. (in: a-proteobacteria)]